MGTLNIVNKSPYERHSLEQCLQRLGDGDSVLLIEDATVAALADSSAAEQLSQALQGRNLYVLAPDLIARGLVSKALVSEAAKVDYSGFVELVTQHERVHSWL